MAISKIMHMKDCGRPFHGMHLKRSIDYIMVPEKTQNGRLIGAVNCLAEGTFEQMRATKKIFEKTDQRQGYHLVLSFKSGEVSADTAFEITRKFVDAYVGERFEAVYAVHDNTDCVHGHIIWNSVSFVDGKKYHYKKGDWEKEILPITNRLCKEYGLSVLELDGERAHSEFREWSGERNSSVTWSEMIKRDLDACILQAVSFSEFMAQLQEKGYACKQGKYFAVKPPGMSRFRRCYSLGEEYSEEKIRQRIEQESLKSYRREREFKSQIVRCHIKRYRRAELSGLQKKYYARIYHIGKLKKRAYSQAWKYRDEIQKLQKVQKQYLFLERHHIHSAAELAAVIDNLTGKDKEVVSEKSRVYKARNRCRELFETADIMRELMDAEEAYKNGDTFFEAEHNRWITLEAELKKKGYSFEEVVKLKEHFRGQIAEVNEKTAAVKRELAIGTSIWRDIAKEGEDRKVIQEEKANIRDRELQPVR